MRQLRMGFAAMACAALRLLTPPPAATFALGLAVSASAAAAAAAAAASAAPALAVQAAPAVDLSAFLEGPPIVPAAGHTHAVALLAAGEDLAPSIPGLVTCVYSILRQKSDADFILLTDERN